MEDKSSKYIQFDTLIAYDYLMQNKIYIPTTEFLYAWKTDSPNTPSNNTYYNFKIPYENVDLSYAIKNGLKLNCYTMQNPWNKFHGLKGMKAFLKEVVDWPYYMNEEKRKQVAYATYIALEVAGTGRGCFRRMFSRFLSEAAKQLGCNELMELSEEYRKLAKLWSELAQLLRESSIDENKGIFMHTLGNRELIALIYNKEHQLISKLDRICSRI